MKTVIITIAIEIEYYELQKVKLQYLETLMKTKENLSNKERIRMIDSLITKESKNVQNDSN